jgi:DNA polymerase III subunit beta
MNVAVNSQRLATELRLLNKVVPSKPAIAILSHCLMSADDHGFNLYATDLEIALSTDCQASVSMPGETALHVARLLSLVEQFPDDDVIIQADGAKVLVSCGAFKSRLQAMPVTDFPRPPQVEGDSSTLDGASLRQMIGRVRYAINATAQKFVMQGALLTLSGQVAAMVATDGKRLALTTSGREGKDERIIIPIKALDMLAGSDAAEVELTVGPKHLHFTSQGRLLTSRTIDGQFPAYDRIIPRDNELAVTVSKGVLMAALKRIVLVSEDNKATYFSITPGAIELSSQSAEVGQAIEAVACAYDGAPLKVCVNGEYVLDFLQAASGASVTLKFKDAKSAMLLMDGEDNVGVIMLLRS